SDRGAYVAGYSSGAYAGASAGDKDAVLARITPAGDVAWARQFGGPGEDKALAVAADANGVYVAGSATAGLPGTSHLGGVDGWLARFTPTGDQVWTRQIGGPDDDLLAGVAISGTGTVVATGATRGDGTAGGSDVLTVAYTEN